MTMQPIRPDAFAGLGAVVNQLYDASAAAKPWNNSSLCVNATLQHIMPSNVFELVFPATLRAMFTIRLKGYFEETLYRISPRQCLSPIGSLRHETRRETLQALPAQSS